MDINTKLLKQISDSTSQTALKVEEQEQFLQKMAVALENIEAMVQKLAECKGK